MQLTRSSAIRIIIAEANELNCQLVQSAFRSRASRVEVVATAVAYDGLVGLLHEHKPDIIIVSVRLQEGPLEGYHVLRDLHLLHLNTRAIMLLDSRERELVVDAFRCGAHGIVFRDEPLETLGKCVHAVYQGQVWANSLHLTYVLEALTQTMPVKLQDARGTDLLSRRQEDVVRLVSEGMTNRENFTATRSERAHGAQLPVSRF